MYCKEPIIKVYNGYPKKDGIDYSDAFLDCYKTPITYLVTSKRRLILETKHFYIALSSEGVSLINKTSNILDLQQDGEVIESCIQRFAPKEEERPFEYYEATLFIGERLIDVQKKNKIFLLRFDDFEMELIPYEQKENESSSTEYNTSHSDIKRVYGTERFLKRKCECGGTGELYMDLVEDFLVACNSCKRKTWASITAIEAIEDWENGVLAEKEKSF